MMTGELLMKDTRKMAKITNVVKSNIMKVYILKYHETLPVKKESIRLLMYNMPIKS
jgi:hypothetical protein